MAEIKYTKKDHIIVQQKASEEAFLAEFAAGDYTLSNPLVKLNPYIICPLSAMILFKTPRPEEVTIIVHGKEAAGDIVHRFPASYEHVLPVYGLYADYDNQVEIVLQDGARHTVTIKTEPLMEGVPESTSIDTTAEYMGDNFVFLTASMRSFPVGYDYAGDLRWYCKENLAFDIKRIRNGHILVGTERLVKMPYFTTGLYEMNFGGKIFKEYVIPCGGYHHDQFQMKDGNLLALTFDFYSGTVEDVCVLLDKDTGEILKKWDYKKVLPQHGPGSGSQTEEDWFHNNAVWYDEKTNSLTFSGRHEDAVINLDYETGELNWIIGDPENWPQEYVDKYFFTPVGDGEFDWQYEQHACVVLPDGDIMLFDNGHYRSKNPDKYWANHDNFSRGVRYRIDTDKMTIEQVWQYGKERGAEFFSPYICNVEYYDEGHYMVHSGGIGYLDGEPCDGFAAVMAMKPEFKDRITFNSITCELVDDKVVYELHVPANCYRAEKLPIYAAGEVFEPGAGEYLGGLIETQTTRMKVKADETGELVPEHYNANIVEEDDRIMFNAIYETGEMVQILLVDEAGNIRRYPVNTVGQDFSAMCVGTFQKENPCDIDTFINKTGLEGPQTVKLLCEDKVYETGIVVNK
ncbi:MAG: aryl-sulfate sulfotransferase [Peptococcaceae bacterium]|nr:aryl-sulfate sulfotransferase [Peptococcaceae bacterium]